MKLYYAIVENNDDPMKLGRCQVRILGKHTPNRADSADQNYLPVADLPWAEAIHPVNSPNISKQSTLFGSPANGSIVIVGFIDEDEQKPLMLGTVPRIADELPDFNIGFSDPDGVNPTEETLGKSPISDYATGEQEPPEVTQKKNNLDSATAVGESWTEPATEWNPDFPENKVIHTRKHVIEIDDTDGKERIQIYHVSGTFEEIHPDGSKVTKIKADRYLIVEGDKNLLVKGNFNITVDGDANLDVGGDANVKTGGNLIVTTGGIASFN